MAKKAKLDCPWCGNMSAKTPCEHCGGSIKTPPPPTPVEIEAEEETEAPAVPVEVEAEAEEEPEADDSDETAFWIVIAILLTMGVLAWIASVATQVRSANESQGVSSPAIVLGIPVWSAPSNVTVFTPDYILNNNVPSLLPSMVVCPNGSTHREVKGQGVCDFSDSHTSSLAGGPSDFTSFPVGESYDTTGSFVWAYNLPDLNATKVAQVPWGTSFPWQGCYEIASGSQDIGSGLLYWTFVYGYGWIDSYQVIGECQFK
jgi:hypothetical protein